MNTVLSRKLFVSVMVLFFCITLKGFSPIEKFNRAVKDLELKKTMKMVDILNVADNSDKLTPGKRKS